MPYRSTHWLISIRCIGTIYLLLSLSACVVIKQPLPGKPSDSIPSSTQQAYSDNTLICQRANNYAGKQVGDGQCVSLIKLCSDAPDTNHWRPGKKVLGQSLAPGTVIATFKNNRYPNQPGYHAAIYIRQDQYGIWVWDQWVGKAVHKRLIRIRKDKASASNTAQAYRVVKLPN